MTFTILARDPRTGELGVGSFSFSLAVGASVAHHAPDSGLAVVQAQGDVTWSARLLASLEPARWRAALGELADDAQLAISQLAGLSVTGQALHYTGAATEPFAGAVAEGDLCCVANLMARADVPRQVADHVRGLDSHLPLAERLVSGLRHADELGGDVRGRMSAFVRTFQRGRTIASVDLRVDVHPDPVTELARLLRLRRAHDLAARARDENGAYSDVALTRSAYAMAPESPVAAGAHLLALLRAADASDTEVRDTAQAALALEPQLPERLERLEAGHRLPTGSAALVRRHVPS